jgi:hypothetical protein
MLDSGPPRDGDSTDGGLAFRIAPMNTLRHDIPILPVSGNRSNLACDVVPGRKAVEEIL